MRYGCLLVILLGSVLVGCGPSVEVVDNNAERVELAGESVVDAATAEAKEPADAPPDGNTVPAAVELANVAEGVPMIKALDPEYDFGEMDNTEKVEHNFVIQNVGKGELRIGKPKTSCGCTVANPEKEVLAPGEETVIKAVLSLTGRQGALTKSITVPSNDPETESLLLRLKGTAVAPIMMDTKMLAFGTIMDDETHRKTLNIKAMKDDLTFNITKVDFTMPGFEVEHKAIVEGREYEVTVFNPAPLEHKNHYGRFTIVTDHPKHRALQFTASATVLGELKVQPQKITLLESNVPDKKTDIAFQVTPGRTKNFELKEVVPPLEGVEVELVTLRQNNYLVKLKGLPQNMTLNGTAAVLKTNLPDRPEIKVPFEVREARKVQQTTRKPPVSANTPQLMVRPSQLTLLESAEATDVTNAVFYVSSGRTVDFSLTEVVPPVAGAKVEINEIQKNYYQVKISDVPRDASMNGKSVIIRTDAKTAPEVKVPIVIQKPNVSRVAPPAGGTVRPANPGAGVPGAAPNG